MNNRKYHVIIGSKYYFSTIHPKIDEQDAIVNFLDIVKLSDESKSNRRTFNNFASVLILKNDNYHGITEQAHDRLGALIEELTYDDSEIYIHNPPLVLIKYLNSIENQDNISRYEEEYHMIKDS